MSYAGEHIWIIGASSGIGRALAFELAQKGAHLILSARRVDVLRHLAKEISESAPSVKCQIAEMDVAEAESVASAFKAVSGTKIDRIIFMAAIYTPPGSIAEMDIDKARTIMDVNLIGALRVSQAALNLFTGQKSGQLALCASVAGYLGLPRGQVYSASKAAMINFAESLNAEAPDYVDIKVINPGFVETPMTGQNDFEMPMIITAEQAATSIAGGLKTSAFEVHFPKKFTFFLKLLNLLPYRLSLFLTKRMGP